MEKLMLLLDVAFGSPAVGRVLRASLSLHVDAASSFGVPVTGASSSVSEVSPCRRLTRSSVCATSLENCLMETCDEEVDDDDDDDDEESLARRWCFMVVFFFPVSAKTLCALQ